MTYNLWLMRASGTRVQCVKAIRDALRVAFADAHTLSEAQAHYNTFLERGPTVLAGTDDESRAQQTLEALRESGVCDGVINPSTEEIREAAKKPAEPEVPVEDGDFQPSIQATMSALTLMAAANGNPSLALQLGQQFTRTTDDDLWADVATLLLLTFPRQS